MNSVHDGLYFGVPSLLVPQQGGQTVIAMRVAELGSGLVLDKSRVSADTIRANAARLLTETSFKVEANRIRESFRASGGVAMAANEIVALLRKGKLHYRVSAAS